MRYFIYFSYRGTAYHGWQIQPNAQTVQEVLTRACSTLLREEIELVAAGRTDTGVHAQCMIAHFDTCQPLTACDELVRKLNNFLPRDIAIQKLVSVKPNAHARFDALSRTYEYRITFQKDVFANDLKVRFYHPLHFERMNEAADTLKDYSDFTSFSKLHTDVKTNNCVVSEARWECRDNEWVFQITADRFLRNMVRSIVGTLIEVGMEKMSVAQFRAIIESKNRCCAGNSMPAHGLYLVHIAYPADIFLVS